MANSQQTVVGHNKPRAAHTKCLQLPLYISQSVVLQGAFAAGKATEQSREANKNVEARAKPKEENGKRKTRALFLVLGSGYFS